MLKELKERVCRANLLLVEYGLVFSKGTPGRRRVFFAAVLEKPCRRSII